MPMLEISLKNTQTTVMDLEQRIRAVLCENEKLKISATEKVQYQVKVQHLTKEQTRLKQELTELEE
jgi:cell shape-determining protein MreC